MTNAFGVSNTMPIKSIIGMTHNDYASLLLKKNNIHALFLYQCAKLIRHKIGFSILKLKTEFSVDYCT